MQPFLMQKISFQKFLFLLSIFSLLSGSLLLNSKVSLWLIGLISRLLNEQLVPSFWQIGFERTGMELILLTILLISSLFFYQQYPKKFLIYSSFSIIGFYLCYVFYNSVNIPIHDDYWQLLSFLNNYCISGNIYSVLDQEAETRFILVRSLGILFFELGIFNFNYFILLINLCLIGICIILYKSIKHILFQKEFFFLILVVLLFQFQFYDATVNTAGGITHSCSLFFSFISFYFLNKNSTTGFIAALLFGVITVFNIPTGFLVFLVGSIILFLQKRFSKIIIWTIATIVTSVLYFKGYSLPEDYSMTDIFSIKIFNYVIFSCVFLGSSFQYMYQTVAPIIVGIIIWVYFLILTVKKYYRKNTMVYVVLLYILLVSLVPPILRSGFGIKDAISVRYGIYSIIALCCCIIAFWENFNTHESKNIHWIIIFSIIYHLSTNIFYYPEVIIRKEKLIAFVSAIKAGKSYKLPPHTPDNAEIIIKESIQKNIYKIPN